MPISQYFPEGGLTKYLTSCFLRVHLLISCTSRGCLQSTPEPGGARGILPSPLALSNNITRLTACLWQYFVHSSGTQLLRLLWWNGSPDCLVEIANGACIHESHTQQRSSFKWAQNTTFSPLFLHHPLFPHGYTSGLSTEGADKNAHLDFSI